MVSEEFAKKLRSHKIVSMRTKLLKGYKNTNKNTTFAKYFHFAK